MAVTTALPAAHRALSKQQPSRQRLPPPQPPWLPPASHAVNVVAEADAVAVMANAVKDAVRDAATVVVIEASEASAATNLRPTAKAVVEVSVVSAGEEAAVVSALTSRKKAAPAKAARLAWTSAARNLKAVAKAAVTVAVARATRVPQARKKSQTATPHRMQRNSKALSTPCLAQKARQPVPAPPKAGKPAKAAVAVAVAVVDATAMSRATQKSARSRTVR